MDIYHEILEKYWGYKNFRKLQLDIIKNVSAKKDTLAILPTGAGKSICYQVPTLAINGKALVISPLIALVKDQVLNLAKRNIKSMAVYSGMSKYDITNTLNSFSSNQVPFLFMSPERLQTKDVEVFLESVELDYLIVDEAHCISQWGYDFRPNYLLIGEKRELLPNTSLLALTASATSIVERDIIEKLNLIECTTLKSSFERNNIAIRCHNVESKINFALNYFKQKNESSIIYCNARYKTKEVSEALNCQNIKTTYYNAGMSEIERTNAQNKWMNNSTSIIVCTNAFGMGIDKPDVRTVMHLDAPDSPEAYYQEIGRAGRDEELSNAVLLYNNADLGKIDAKVNFKYPLPEKIKAVYTLVMQYCNIAYEQGEDETCIFDLDAFCENYKLNRNETFNCLKILEQNNYWKLSEGLFLPAKVFVTAKLYEINFLEDNHKNLYTIIQALLRLYGGILSGHVKINIIKLSEFTNTNTQHILNSLHQLHNLGLIDFVEAIDKPFIYFLGNRLREYEWQIDINLYNTLKQRYKERLIFMENYITNTKICKMKLLVNYFDSSSEYENCGKCENCISKRVEKLSNSIFKRMSIKIINILADQNKTPISELYKIMSSYKENEIAQTLDFLLKEKYLVLNQNGELQLL